MPMKHVKKPVVILIAAMIFIMSFSGCSAFAFTGGTQEIVFSEVVSSNSGSLTVQKLGSPDWIELYNATDHAIDLEGYTLSRADQKEANYTFSSQVIEPGAYLLVMAADAAGGEEYDYPCAGFKLPREGTNLVLKNADGKTVTKISVPALDRDVSWCLYEDAYRYCMTATPGAQNGGLIFDSADDMYSQPAPEGIIINEASISFLELYNNGSGPAQLAYFTLSDDAGDLSKWRLPYYELQPGEYFVISLDGSGEHCASFGISREEGYIYLSYNGDEYAMTDVSGLWENMSAGLNAEGETVYFADTTPGAPNSSVYSQSNEISVMDENAAVRISELMLDNENCLVDEDGDRPDWVELHNSSDAAVNLKNYFLSDNTEDSLKWQLPDTDIQPDGYIIIYLSGKGGELHTTFRVSEGEPLILTDYSTLSQQTVMFPDESRLSNISYGVQDGNWLFFGKGTPGKANTAKGSESISNVEKLDKTNAFISEISASFAARSNGRDWIELYNPSDSSFSLDGLFISDDLSRLDLFPLSGSISPGGYTVVYASDKTSKQGADTAPFSISQAGETVYLSDGTSIVDAFDTGALRYGTTSGRTEGDLTGKRVFFSTPTKGEKNSAPLGGQLNSPEFSEPGGIVSGDITLELSGEGQIYYTTDGSVPTQDSTLYTQPIAITENTVITAICTENGRLSSDPATVTYLFEEAHTLPIVCLSSAPADFNSVYAVSTWSSNKSNNVERRCYIEYYEADGTPGTGFPAGFRVSGNSTRSYPQKSLGIYLRSGYGQTSVVYPFFENYAITEFKSLVLRNAGQNCQNSRMSDAYASMLFSDLNVDTAQTRFVVVYINGRYWGIYDLKENQNEDGFAAQHGVDADEINVIRRNTFAIAGNNSQIKQVYSYAQSWNLSNDEKYNDFCEYVDADAWIDYIIARSYSGDGDIFNQKLWNTASYSSKWRPIFYDCDFAFGSSTANTLSQYFTGDGVASPDGSLTNMYIPTALKKNAGWCEKLLIRYSEVMKYYPEYSLELYDKMADELRPEMKRHIERWGLPRGGFSGWEEQIRSQRQKIAARPENIVRQIQNCFGVSSERMKELFPDFY